MEPKETKKGAREATRAPKGESENEQKSLEGSAKIDIVGARGGEKDDKRGRRRAKKGDEEGSEAATTTRSRKSREKVRSGRGGSSLGRASSAPSARRGGVGGQYFPPWIEEKKQRGKTCWGSDTPWAEARRI